MKNDLDITHVPDVLSVPWIKRFFKHYFSLPVRVHFDTYIEVSVDEGATLEGFPEFLGRACCKAIHTNFIGPWGGPVEYLKIALMESQWRSVFARVIRKG